MTQLYLTILISIIVVPTFGQKSLMGEYVTNFPTYGMFGKTLKLNCDSTAVLNFRGDLMNDNSNGHWRIDNKILTIFFDTTKSLNSRYKDTLRFRIKGKRLFSIGLTMEQYVKYKLIVDQHNQETGENVVMPSYQKFNKQQSETPKNYYGKTGKQFFKKAKSYLCER